MDVRRAVMTLPRWLRGPYRMTEATWWLVAALGWLLITWGLALALGRWVLPLGLGLGCLAVFVGYVGLQRLRLWFVVGARQLASDAER